MTEKRWISDFFIIILVLSLFFGLFLDNRPLGVPDEARYSEIPREMLLHHDYVTPRLNDIVYFEKPPLLYWLQCAAIKMGGYEEWVLRLPTLLMAILGCLITYSGGRFLFERRTGLLATFILASSWLYFVMAHLITTDMTLSVFLTASLLTFIIGVRAPPRSRERRCFLYAFYICIALAMLTKGLVAIVFPCLIIGTWVLLLNQWQLLKSSYLISGTLLFLLIALPWHLLAQQQHPEFFHFYFIEQHFLRYMTLYAGRYQPVWFFFPILLIGFFPWIVFLPQAIKFHLPSLWSERFSHKEIFFLFLWIAIIFSFFSLSKSKLIPYILPIFPALSILVGHYFASHWEQARSLGLRIGFSLLPLIGIMISVSLLCLLKQETIAEPLLANQYVLILSAILVFGTLLANYLYWRLSLSSAFAVLVVTSTLALLTALLAAPHVDARSAKPIALVLKPLLKKNDEVVSYDTYYQDLPFYLQQRITIVDWQNELTFGMQLENTSTWMIDKKTFWKRWEGKSRIFMVMDRDKFENLPYKLHRKFYPVLVTMDYVLLSNQRF